MAQTNNPHPPDQPALPDIGDPIDTLTKPAEYINATGALFLTCAVGECHYSCRYGNDFEDFDKARTSFKRHLAQHLPGKTPNLTTLRITVNGTCTNCGNHFSIDDYEDGERIWCYGCPASWDESGCDGRTDLQPAEEEAGYR